jgi:hypothetical protein
MSDQGQHVSDEDLLLAADGELGKRIDQVRSHLGGCERCRARAALLENTMADVAQAERDAVELPPIATSRAVLQSRLADLSTGRASFLSRIFGDILAGAIGIAALASVMIIAGLLVLRHSTTTNATLSLQSSSQGLLPNQTFTPGATRQASLGEVCSMPREEVVKAVSPEARQRVFAEYGIDDTQSDKYEVDYLITPGLGGEDDIRNLWPQPYDAATWNAHAKDVLEERLHEMVCSNQLDLSVAQAAIATNWIAAYKKYVDAAPENGSNPRSIFPGRL